MKRFSFTETSRRHGWAAAAALILLSLGVPALAREESAPPGTGLQVTVERLGNFCYAGDPVLVRVAVFNTGKTPYDNSRGIDLLGNMMVGDSNAALKHKASPTGDLRQQPPTIAAGGFFGVVADLRDVVEGLDKPGNFVARYSSQGVESEPIPLVVIARYDPSKAYRATIETDFGTMQFDLFGKEAPAHVHNFYDLGNQGYYDGTLFHVVVKGIEVRGGDRTGDGESSPGYSLQPEIDKSLKHARGTLSMLRGDKTDHGAQFLIGLAGSPNLDGLMTVFGTMAGGDDALQAIENLPTSGQKSYPFYRPLKDARIRSVRVAPAPAGSRATAGGVEGPAAKSPSKP